MVANRLVAEFSRTDGVGEGLSEDGCMESVPFISVRICFPVDLFVSYSSLYHTSQDIAFIKIQESRAEVELCGVRCTATSEVSPCGVYDMSEG